jgi:hypothetical protein
MSPFRHRRIVVNSQRSALVSNMASPASVFTGQRQTIDCWRRDWIWTFNAIHFISRTKRCLKCTNTVVYWSTRDSKRKDGAGSKRWTLQHLPLLFRRPPPHSQLWINIPSSLGSSVVVEGLYKVETSSGRAGIKECWHRRQRRNVGILLHLWTFVDTHTHTHTHSSSLEDTENSRQWREAECWFWFCPPRGQLHSIAILTLPCVADCPWARPKNVDVWSADDGVGDLSGYCLPRERNALNFSRSCTWGPRPLRSDRKSSSSSLMHRSIVLDLRSCEVEETGSQNLCVWGSG